MQTVVHILVEFIWPLPVPATEVLDVARVTCAGAGRCTVAIDAAVLAHWHTDFPMSCKASIAYARVVCCERQLCITVSYLTLFIVTIIHCGIFWVWHCLTSRSQNVSKTRTKNSIIKFNENLPGWSHTVPYMAHLIVNFYDCFFKISKFAGIGCGWVYIFWLPYSWHSNVHDRCPA